MKPEDDEIDRMARIPIREFFFTLDQIAYMLDATEATVIQKYLYFQGREFGPRKGRMEAVNIASNLEGVAPDWRVRERAFVAWCRERHIDVHSTVRETYAKPPRRGATRRYTT